MGLLMFILISDVAPKIRVNGELLNITGFENTGSESIIEMRTVSFR